MRRFMLKIIWLGLPKDIFKLKQNLNNKPEKQKKIRLATSPLMGLVYTKNNNSCRTNHKKTLQKTRICGKICNKYQNKQMLQQIAQQKQQQSSPIPLPNTWSTQCLTFTSNSIPNSHIARNNTKPSIPKQIQQLKQ